MLLLGIAALAVDLGYDRQLTRHLQVGTDAGALAGALELPNGSTTNATKITTARLTAAGYAVASLVDGTTPTLPSPTCSGNTCTYVLGSLTIRVTSPYTPAGGLPTDYSAHNFIDVEACERVRVHVLTEDTLDRFRQHAAATGRPVLLEAIHHYGYTDRHPAALHALRAVSPYRDHQASGPVRVCIHCRRGDVGVPGRTDGTQRLLSDDYYLRACGAIGAVSNGPA